MAASSCLVIALYLLQFGIATYTLADDYMEGSFWDKFDFFTVRGMRDCLGSSY